MSAGGSGRVATAFGAKLASSTVPGMASDSDGRALLADNLAASAVAKADGMFLALGDFMAGGDRTPKDLATFFEAGGMAVLDGWTALMARTGHDREPWARKAALQATLAYCDRLAALMAASNARDQT